MSVHGMVDQRKWTVRLDSAHGRRIFLEVVSFPVQHKCGLIEETLYQGAHSYGSPAGILPQEASHKVTKKKASTFIHVNYRARPVASPARAGTASRRHGFVVL